MTFGRALERLRESVPMRRESWKNTQCHIALSSSELWATDESWQGKHLAIRTDPSLRDIAWNPTTQDLFAEDWEVFVTR